MNQILEQTQLRQDGCRLLNQLTQNAGIGLYVLTFSAQQPVCEFANLTWARWTGHSTAEPSCQGRDWLLNFHCDDRVRIQQLYLQVFLTECAQTTEYRIPGGQGDNLWISDSIFPLFDEDGRTLGVGGCAQDISGVKAARQQMQRMQLLQSLGGLMAGIAHEMNSPLQFIGDNLHYLSDAWAVLSSHLGVLSEGLRQISQDPQPAVIDSILHQAEQSRKECNMAFTEREVPIAVGQTLEGVERLIRLVSAMRDFSHLDERRQAPADLNRAVSSALTLLHNQLKYICDVQTQLAGDLPQVNCSIDEINRVILNLLINASHGICEKIEQGVFNRGVIRIGTRCLENGVQISVEDNGIGIAPEIQPHIFERFFTTKRHHPERKGTGQGLSMAHEIVVEHHRGALTFKTQPGEGTVFDIFLPFQQSGPKGDI